MVVSCNQAKVRRAAKAAGRACLFVLLLPVLSACAYTHVKPDGSIVMIGLSMTTLPPGASADSGPRTVSSRVIGVTLFRTPVGSSISIGYTRDGITLIGEDQRTPAAGCLSADGRTTNIEQGTQYVSSLQDDVPDHVWLDDLGLLDLGLLRNQDLAGDR